jgi:hypothetical protein
MANQAKSALTLSIIDEGDCIKAKIAFDPQIEFR